MSSRDPNSRPRPRHQDLAALLAMAPRMGEPAVRAATIGNTREAHGNDLLARFSREPAYP